MPLFNIKNVGWLGSLSVGELPDEAFASLYEAFNPLTTVAKTHLVEWFSGDALDSSWTEAFAQLGSLAMADEVDGGLLLQSGTTNNGNSIISFGGINHYSATAAVSIMVKRSNQTTAFRGDGAFVDSHTSPQHFSLVGQDSKSSSTTDFQIRTNNGTGVTTTAATFALDTNYHVHKVELASSTNIYTIDGVLEVTKSDKLPSNDQQPYHQCNNGAAANKTVNIRYMEVYST